MRVREPAAYGDGMLWMENVRGRRVVDDYSLSQITSDLGEILDCIKTGFQRGKHRTNLHVIALVVITAFTKESMMNYMMYVELVKKRISVL